MVGNPVPEQEVKDSGMFNCFSDHWGKVFEEHPTPDKLFDTYIDSPESFLMTGMYLFCEDVRSGEHDFIEFGYDPGYAYGETAACLENREVKRLNNELDYIQTEYLFWLNFNEWAEEVYE